MNPSKKIVTNVVLIDLRQKGRIPAEDEVLENKLNEVR